MKNILISLAFYSSFIYAQDKIETAPKVEDKQSVSAIEQAAVVVNNCLENRSGLDVGSGSTKFKIYKYNSCDKKIGELIFEKQFAIAFKENLSQSKENNFSESILGELKKALFEVLEENKKFNVQKFRGVATEAFRQSQNGAEFLKKLGEELKINIDIISQEEEASLGFKSAFNGLDSDNTKSKVMWDIGGGSMQIVVQEQGVFHSYLGKMASVSFKELVVEKIKNKNVSEVNSPNPLTNEEVAKANQLARDEASKIPEQFRQKIKADSLIVGVGGVFQYSVLNQLKKDNEFQVLDLDISIKDRIGQSDADFKSEYAATELTNLILVSNFMKTLGITQVFVRKANLTEAIILD